jgi:hypothetical protein
VVVGRVALWLAWTRLLTRDEQPRSYAGPQVCNRTNEISLAPQKSASRRSSFGLELGFEGIGTDRRQVGVRPLGRVVDRKG